MRRKKKIPLRRCVGCREMKDKRELLRIVKSNEGEIFVDPTGKKNGRGAYICKDKSCYEQAVKAKSLSREFGCEIPKEVYEDISQHLEEHGGE